MRKLLILSGKGGTGKTTVAAAFIDFLRAKGFADCDVDAPNLHLVTRMDIHPERKDYYGSQKAIIDPFRCTGCGLCLAKCRFSAITQYNSHCKINEYACEGCGICQYVCPANAVSLVDDVAGEQILYKGSRVFSTAKLKMGRGNSGKLVTEVKTALFKFVPKNEFAIIDGSPGIGCPVIASVSGVDLVLIVTEPSLSGIHDMRRILKTTRLLGTKVAVCVNKSDTCPQNAKAIQRFCAENDTPFVGLIPYDKQVAVAINAGHSLADVDCPARTALKSVLEKVLPLLKESRK